MRARKNKSRKIKNNAAAIAVTPGVISPNPNIAEIPAMMMNIVDHLNMMNRFPYSTKILCHRPAFCNSLAE